jgi:hypothetical protein
MTDPAIPRPDAITDAYVAEFLKGVSDETYAEVIKGVLAADCPLEEKLKMAFSSGVTYAAESVFSEFRGMVDSAIDTMADSVKGIDSFMHQLTPDQIAALSIWRNTLAEFIHAHAINESVEEKIQRVTSFYGVPEDYLKPDFDPRALSKSSLAQLAMTISHAHNLAFVAYFALREDPTLPCKCVGHVLAAWQNLSHFQQLTEAHKVYQRYPPDGPSVEGAVAQFVGWWLDHARENYAVALAEGDDELPPITAEAASRVITQDALTRIMHSSKGSNNGDK